MASDSTAARVVRLVGTGKRVLELGCSTGYMSRVLSERGCRVVAVEQDAEAADRAQPFCERVIMGDIEQLDLTRVLRKHRFDVVVAADFLEHLKDPLELLRELKSFLREDGYIVASVPNVAHGSVRLALLGGEFPYRPTGLLDRSHLRFYTRGSLLKLFEAAGFVIRHLELQNKRIDDSEVPFDRAAVPPAVLEAVSRDPEALTYQFIVVAHPLPLEGLAFVQGTIVSAVIEKEAAEARSRQLADEGDALRRRVEDLEAQQQTAEARIRELTQERDQARSDFARLHLTLEEQTTHLDALSVRAEELARREVELRRLLHEAHEQLLARDAELQRWRRLDNTPAERDCALAAQQATIDAKEPTIASSRAELAEALARMAGMRRTRVWRIGMVYWWIEARVKSLLRI
jgi:2-polyprenyl-3-methyl-5-hydroxy-6-metoxy-1,4-benzoquinol methylase